MKSFNNKILLYISILLLTVFLCLGVITNVFSSTAMIENASDYMMQLAAQGAKLVESRLVAQIETLEYLATMREIYDDQIPLDKKMEILKAENGRKGHIMMAISDIEGNSTSTNGITSNIKDREYFKKVLSGKSTVSDPIISNEDHTLVIVYAVPIKRNNEVTGVLMAIRSGDDLSNITDDITLHKTGRAFIINSEGTTIAHINEYLVFNMDNDFENIKKDPSLGDLVAIERRMVNGEIGFGSYLYNGQKKFLAFHPIKEMGWSLAVAVRYEEILYNLNSLKFYLKQAYMGLMAVFLVLAIFIANRISVPIKNAVKHLDSIAAGDYSLPMPDNYINKKDEIGALARAIAYMQKTIKELIYNLNEKNNEMQIQKEEIEALYEETTAMHDDVTQKNTEIVSQKEEIEALYEETIAMNDELNNLFDKLKSSYLRTVTSMAKAIEAKDSYTGGHCQRVTEYSIAIAKRMGLQEEEITILEFAAQLHDIGKIAIDSAILNKEGSLTEEEYGIIKTHPRTGFDIVAGQEFLYRSGIVICQHHERVDGKGYPYGSMANEIDELAKIMAITDSYDAMTSSRPYRRQPLTKEEAIEELHKNKASQFDEKITNIFIELLQDGTIE